MRTSIPPNHRSRTITRFIIHHDNLNLIPRILKCEQSIDSLTNMFLFIIARNHNAHCLSLPFHIFKKQLPIRKVNKQKKAQHIQPDKHIKEKYKINKTHGINRLLVEVGPPYSYENSHRTLQISSIRQCVLLSSSLPIPFPQIS